MPCDRKLKTRRDGTKQTVAERKQEIRKVVERISQGLTTGRIKPVVSKQGAIAFTNVTEDERDGVTDACAYRQLMVHGSALAKAAIARAEQLAGRTVDKQVIGQGAHSHDGGLTWHDHK
jgi:hypothetical protein